MDVEVQNLGKVPIEANCVPMSYGIAITSSTPSSGTDNGGYVAELTGTGFPTNIKLLEITICGKKVTINSATNTLIEIIIPNCGTAGANTISLTYDSYSADTAFSYTAASMATSITSISPSSASPVLKQIMTITGSGFGTDENLVTVRLANYDMPKFYEMKILEISNT